MIRRLTKSCKFSIVRYEKENKVENALESK